MVGDGTLGHMTLKLVLSCCSLTKSCPTLCDPVDCSTPGFPVLHYLREFAQTHVHWVGDAIQPSRLCCTRLLLPSVFPSIKVFSSVLALPIRWPKYWSFSIRVEYSGLISFRLNVHGWFPLDWIFRIDFLLEMIWYTCWEYYQFRKLNQNE